MIGRCQVYDVIGAVDFDEPNYAQCTATGRLIIESMDPGHPSRKRFRIVCYDHGLDTCPDESIVPEPDCRPGWRRNEFGEETFIDEAPSYQRA